LEVRGLRDTGKTAVAHKGRAKRKTTCDQHNLLIRPRGTELFKKQFPPSRVM